MWWQGTDLNRRPPAFSGQRSAALIKMEDGATQKAPPSTAGSGETNKQYQDILSHLNEW